MQTIEVIVVLKKSSKKCTNFVDENKFAWKLVKKIEKYRTENNKNCDDERI